MLGAILIAGFVALVSSTLATFNNLALSKRFPGLEWEVIPHLAQDVYVRIVCYRLVARLFYIQALFFWLVFAVLVIAKLLGFG
jgi:hypothetical protein